MFKDVPSDHTHAEDIEWLAEKEVTKGANPPANDLYRPDEPVTRAQMASFLRRLYELNHAPEPEPDRKLLWSTDFSNGYADYIKSDPFSNSGNARHEVVDAPNRDGKAVAMIVTNADAGTGVRLRQDGATIDIPGYSGAKNLPDDAYYSGWFCLPEHIRIGQGDGGKSADAWNIFQFKQTWPRDSSSVTRRLLDSLKLRDLGGEYGFTVKSRILDDGSWSVDTSVFREWVSDAVTVRAGEWFHIEAHRIYSGGLSYRINGQPAFDLDIKTEMSGGDWEDYRSWRRQWTVNNYVVGNHTPNSHTLYVTDLAIHTE